MKSQKVSCDMLAQGPTMLSEREMIDLESERQSYELALACVNYGLADLARRAFASLAGQSRNKDVVEPALDSNRVDSIALPTQQEFEAASYSPFEHQGAMAATHIFDHGGRQYIAKHADDGDIANEIAASRIRRLIGMDAPTVDRRVDPRTGDAFAVMPMLPGQSWNQIKNSPNKDQVARISLFRKLENKLMGSDAVDTAKEFGRLAKSISKEDLGRHAFSNWFLNRADMHANNNLVREGGVHPIDFGFVFGPRSSRQAVQWGKPGDVHAAHPDAVLQFAGYDSLPKLSTLPIPKEHLQAAMDNRKQILDTMRGLVLPHYTSVAYRPNDVLDSYNGKFSQIGNALKSGKPTIGMLQSPLPGYTPHRPGFTLAKPHDLGAIDALHSQATVGEKTRQQYSMDDQTQPQFHDTITFDLYSGIHPDDPPIGRVEIVNGQVVSSKAFVPGSQNYMDWFLEHPYEDWAGYFARFAGRAESGIGLHARAVSGQWPEPRD